MRAKDAFANPLFPPSNRLQHALGATGTDGVANALPSINGDDFVSKCFRLVVLREGVEAEFAYGGCRFGKKFPKLANYGYGVHLRRRLNLNSG